LTYSTATGRAVIHSLHMTVFLLLSTTTGTRGIATTHRDTSVKVSSQLYIHETVM